MNREIQERDDPVQILETKDHRGYALKAIFDGETCRKIQGLKLNLKVEKLLLTHSLHGRSI
uniref:Putative ovule protein n=1 Tax=Solanum chacoense TaxID=4108 RepID=A0A0V0GRQ5_SOLCH